MVVTFTEMRKNIRTYLGGWAESQKFCPGHIKFEMSIVHPNGYVRQTVKDKNQELRKGADLGINV